MRHELRLTALRRMHARALVASREGKVLGERARGRGLDAILRSRRHRVDSGPARWTAGLLRLHALALAIGRAVPLALGGCERRTAQSAGSAAGFPDTAQTRPYFDPI